MLNCYADLETKSECDLKKHGTAVYAEHPTTDIQIFRYAFEDGEVKLWSKEEGHPMPNDLKAAFANPDVIFWYHNAWFDRNLIENVLKIKIPLNRYRCSMAAALSHGLPASLEALGTVLGLKEDFRKIKDGKRLVMKFCKPKKQSDGSFKWATPKTDPEDWARYLEYSGNDVIAMRECIKKTPKWNYPKQDNELALWLLDQKINSRGMYMDLTLANSAMDAIDLAQRDLAKATKRMTNGDVDTAGQRDAMLKHIAIIYGYDLPNMQKAAIERLVEDVNTPFALKELLSVRLSSSTTSTAKYKKIVDVTSADSRLRGTIQYCGAARTGRDCLAENTLITVLTPTGMVEEKPIQYVELTDLVWDGIGWVKHEGVVFSGFKNVINHDGVCATREHIVYLEDGISVRLEEAKIKGLKLWKGNQIYFQFTK